MLTEAQISEMERGIAKANAEIEKFTATLSGKKDDLHLVLVTLAGQIGGLGTIVLDLSREVLALKEAEERRRRGNNFGV